MQHELLMVLAGYPTSLNAGLLLHPAEQDMFEQAIEFGGRFRSVKTACRLSAEPLTRVIEKTVVRPFLKCLVDIEKQILSGEGIYGSYPSVSLAAIFADSVFKWDRRLEYAQNLLDFEGPTAELITQTKIDTLSGYPDVAEMACACLKELDEAWLREISSWVLWGQQINWTTAKHPELDKETIKIMWDIGFCLHKIDTTKFCQTSQNREILMSNRAVYNAIKVPIVAEDIRAKTRKMKEQLFKEIMAQPAFSGEMEPLLSALRNIVLAGSSSFTRSFQDTLDKASGEVVEVASSELLLKAIATYYEDYDEISPECVAICEKMLTLAPMPAERQTDDGDQFDDFFFGTRVSFGIKTEWPYDLFFTEQQCRVYTDVSCYLLAISLVIARLDTGKRTPETHRYGLFLKTLWQHFQWCLDQLFTEVKACCKGLPGQHTDQHNKALKSLGRQILFDDFESRTAMRRLLVSALAASEGRSTVDGIAFLLDALAQRTDLTELMLLLDPFVATT